MSEIDQEEEYLFKVTYSKVTKLPVRQLSYLNDQMESPPDGSPAEVHYDESGRVKEMVWRSQGTIHRAPEDGPAIIWIDPETGVHTLEHYKVNGKSSRSADEPAYIERDSDGTITRSSYYLDGKRLHPPSEDNHLDMEPR